MGCDVFANNNEISCKAGDNKVIAQMPDVCMSPPSPPAGPIPVPYPATSFSKDMQNGSKTVTIKGKEVMLKDSSFFKSSPLGDEAATRSFGGNLVSHVITGKTYYAAWSMDVMFEGLNVPRHLDLTTSNNGSAATTTAPTPSLATMTPAQKAKAGHQMEDKPHCPPDGHSWDCNTYSCPDCWNKPCEPNAKVTNEAYQGKQAGTPADKVTRQKADLDDKIAKGVGDPAGHRFEKDAIDKTVAAAETIEFLGYVAHCKVCHFKQEVDIITSTAMKECKKGARNHDLGQMKRYKSINDQCFGGKKQLTCVTTAAELPALVRKVGSPDWAPLKPTAEDP